MVQPRNERSASLDSEVHVTSLSSDHHNYDQTATDAMSLKVRCACVSVAAHSPAASVIFSNRRTKGGRISKTFSMADGRGKRLQGYFSILCDQPSVRGIRLRSHIFSNAGACGPKELLHVREASGNSSCRGRFDVGPGAFLRSALRANANAGD
jgi:hypothetical protein